MDKKYGQQAIAVRLLLSVIYKMDKIVRLRIWCRCRFLYLNRNYHVHYPVHINRAVKLSLICQPAHIRRLITDNDTVIITALCNKGPAEIFILLCAQGLLQDKEMLRTGERLSYFSWYLPFFIFVIYSVVFEDCTVVGIGEIWYKTSVFIVSCGEIGAAHDYCTAVYRAAVGLDYEEHTVGLPDGVNTVIGSDAVVCGISVGSLKVSDLAEIIAPCKG